MVRFIFLHLFVIALSIESFCQISNNVPSSIQFDPSSKSLIQFMATNKDGNLDTIRLVKDRWTLIDFSASYCGYCILGIDKVAALHQQYEKYVDFVVLWNDRDQKTWLEYQKERKEKITWTNLRDPNGSIFKAFEITIFPTYMLIDPTGKIVKEWRGGKTPALDKFVN